MCCISVRLLAFKGNSKLLQFFPYSKEKVFKFDLQYKLCFNQQQISLLFGLQAVALCFTVNSCVLISAVFQLVLFSFCLKCFPYCQPGCSVGKCGLSFGGVWVYLGGGGGVSRLIFHFVINFSCNLHSRCFLSLRM